MKGIAFVLTAGLGSVLALTAMAQSYEDSVVLLQVSKEPIDQGAPWQRENMRQEVHLAVVVDDRHLLTTAFAARDSVAIEWLRFGSTQKQFASVRHVDLESNLALLQADLSGARLRPASWGGAVPSGTEVNVAFAKSPTKLRSMSMRVVDVEVRNSATSMYSLPTYGIAAPKEQDLGWSEPLFSGGRAVALATGRSGELLSAIPAPVIAHYLEDHLQGKEYRGFPAIGVRTRTVRSPHVRAMLKIPPSTAGVLVAEVFSTSAFAEILQQNDLLTAIDGQLIDMDGFTRHETWGRLHFTHLVNRRFAGDSITLTYFREGKSNTATARLTRFSSEQFLTPFFHAGGDVPYLIFGGLVLRELSVDYLKRWGKEWDRGAPIALLRYWMMENEPTDDNHRRIVLSEILADESNRGYDAVRNSVLSQVNDLDVRNIAELMNALSQPTRGRDGQLYAKLKFELEGAEIILSYDAIAPAQDRIVKTYGLPSSARLFEAKNASAGSKN